MALVARLISNPNFKYIGSGRFFFLFSDPLLQKLQNEFQFPNYFSRLLLMTLAFYVIPIDTLPSKHTQALP